MADYAPAHRRPALAAPAGDVPCGTTVGKAERPTGIQRWAVPVIEDSQGVHRGVYACAQRLPLLPVPLGNVLRGDLVGGQELRVKVIPVIHVKETVLTLENIGCSSYAFLSHQSRHHTAPGGETGTHPFSHSTVKYALAVSRALVIADTQRVDHLLFIESQYPSGSPR